jgi:hypothetical protein
MRFFTTAGPSVAEDHYCLDVECHLVLFDRSGGVDPEEKLFEETREHEGRTIMIWGM